MVCVYNWPFYSDITFASQRALGNGSTKWSMDVISPKTNSAYANSCVMLIDVQSTQEGAFKAACRFILLLARNWAGKYYVIRNSKYLWLYHLRINLRYCEFDFHDEIEIVLAGIEMYAQILYFHSTQHSI